MRVSTRFRPVATRVPPRARLTVPDRDPRDRDPRPQALVVQQTALGGTSPRGGCASQSRDQRRRASLVAADAAGALFHERDFSRASPCVASVAPPPKSAPPLLRHTRWTETEVFAPTKCGKLRRRRGGGGDENRDPRGAAGGGGGAPWGSTLRAGEPADGAGVGWRLRVRGRRRRRRRLELGRWRRRWRRRRARRDQPLDRRVVPGRNPMWATTRRGVAWLGRCSTRSPRWPSTGGGGSAAPAVSSRGSPRRVRRRRAARRRARRRLPGVHRVRARAQAAAQAVHVGVNAPSRPSGLFRTTRRTRLDGRAFVVIYFCSYCTPTVYSYRVFTPCAR